MRRWLRSSAIGSCTDGGPRLPALPSPAASCTSGQAGLWEVPGHVATWMQLAHHCTERCVSCRNCRHISLSAQLDHCTWHRTCPRLTALDTIDQLPFRPSTYRTAMAPAIQLAHMPTSPTSPPSPHARAAARAEAATRRFLAESGIGTCGRARWHRVSDCEVTRLEP